MRKLLLLAILTLAGCATAAPPPNVGIPVHGTVGGYQCSNTGLDQFIGQAPTAELGAEMLRVSGARIIRWVRVGEMITMEYNPERLTVRLGPGNQTIARASCG